MIEWYHYKLRLTLFFGSDLKIQCMNNTEAEWKFRLLLNTHIFFAITERISIMLKCKICVQSNTLQENIINNCITR